MRSGPCPNQISLNEDGYVAFIHASNWITLHTELVHTVELFEIAYGTSWKLRRRSRMRTDDEFMLHLPKAGEMIYMP